MEPEQAYAYVVKKAEAPAGIRGCVMTGRPYNRESGIAPIGLLCGENCAACCERGQLIKKRVALDLLMVKPPMSAQDVFFSCRLRPDDLIPVAFAADDPDDTVQP